MKTAEEMFHEVFNVSPANGLVHTPPEFIISTMQTFAAQEVEAYKSRLEARLLEHFKKNSAMHGFDLRIIIDTVK